MLKACRHPSRPSQQFSLTNHKGQFLDALTLQKAENLLQTRLEAATLTKFGLTLGN
jgi:hypothetical protein